MRIGICDDSESSRRLLSKWIGQYCGAYDVAWEVAEFRSGDEFFFAVSLRRFDAVFMGFAGPEGFLNARRLREMDKQVKLVFISDTDRFALGGVRLHFLDYIVRPVEFKHIVRAMRLAGIPGGM